MGRGNAGRRRGNPAKAGRNDAVALDEIDREACKIGRPTPRLRQGADEIVLEVNSIRNEAQVAQAADEEQLRVIALLELEAALDRLQRRRKIAQGRQDDAEIAVRGRQVSPRDGGFALAVSAAVAQRRALIVQSERLADQLSGQVAAATLLRHDAKKMKRV